MSVEQVQAEVTKIASRYAGRAAEPSDQLYADLGINRFDIIEFVEEVEQRYSVELHWLCPPRRGEGEFLDATLEAIAIYVASQLSGRL